MKSLSNFPAIKTEFEQKTLTIAIELRRTFTEQVTIFYEKLDNWRENM